MEVVHVRLWQENEVDLDNHDRHGKIGFMTMPDATQDIGPSVAELARFIQDFRNEFRSAVETMVRKDVYAANLATMEAKMATMEVKMAQVQAENMRLDAELKTDRTGRGNLRTGLLITAAGTIFTFVTGIILALVVK